MKSGLLRDNDWNIVGAFGSGVWIQPGELKGLPEWLERDGNRVDLRWEICERSDHWTVERTLSIYIAPQGDPEHADGCWVKTESSEHDFDVQPTGKTLRRTQHNERKVVAAIGADFELVLHQLHQLDQEAVLQQAAEQQERERTEQQARQEAYAAEREAYMAEQRAKAEKRLHFLQEMASWATTPGSGLSLESVTVVDDFVAAGLLAVATAITGSSRIKERDYGPLTLGRIKNKDQDKFHPWVETPVWDGTWRYSLRERSRPHEIDFAEEKAAEGNDAWLRSIRREDVVVRRANTVVARATDSGIVLNRKSMHVRPTRYSEDWYLLRNADMEEVMLALPETVWRSDITPFAREQAAGRIRYLNQQDKVLAWEGDINQHYVRKGWCRWCGKALEREESITRGVGSQCWGRAAKAFRAMAGTELLDGLHEYAVPADEVVFTGLIEEAPSKVIEQLDAHTQEQLRQRQEVAA